MYIYIFCGRPDIKEFLGAQNLKDQLSLDVVALHLHLTTIFKPLSLKDWTMEQVKAFNYLGIEIRCPLSFPPNMLTQSQYSLLADRFKTPN